MKKIFLIPAVLALCSCAKSYPVYETETVQIKPPLLLLEPVPVPPFAGHSNEDLLLYTLTLEESLCLCNARLDAIKKSVE